MTQRRSNLFLGSDLLVHVVDLAVHLGRSILGYSCKVSLAVALVGLYYEYKLLLTFAMILPHLNHLVDNFDFGISAALGLANQLRVATPLGDEVLNVEHIERLEKEVVLIWVRFDYFLFSIEKGLRVKCDCLAKPNFGGVGFPVEGQKRVSRRGAQSIWYPGTGTYRFTIPPLPLTFPSTIGYRLSIPDI